MNVSKHCATSPSDDELWPALPAPEDHLLELEEQLMRRLAGIAPALATSAHDPSMPDLFGQAYRHLFDAAFRAVIDARTDLATVFFPMIIDVAERARQRLGIRPVGPASAGTLDLWNGTVCRHDGTERLCATHGEG